MSEELIFYTNPMSRGRIVRWMLEEVGAPYRTEMLDYGTTMKDADYLAINPMGKVPAIKHGDSIVTECAAICAYLADAFPEAGLAPAPQDRADYYRWMFFAAGPVEAVLADTALGLKPSADQERMVGYGSLAAVTDALEGAVKGKRYIAGDRFSAADVYVSFQIDWAMHTGVLEKRRAFIDYCAGLNERPACKRVAEIDGPVPS